MRCFAVVLFVLALLLASCGGGPGLRPDAPTASGTMGETCSVALRDAEPLVVDWAPHQRADLEEAMNDGLAVVAYDCKSLRLLRGCRVAGDYGFLAFSEKTEVVHFTNDQEVNANLPTFGSVLLKDVGGSLERGQSIDLAYDLVGKRRTTVQSVDRRALVGGAACEGATHIVKGAFVGAFAMSTSTKGELSTAAAIFGAAKTGSSKIDGYRDGDPDSCKQQTADATSAPASCGAIVRVELRPVDSAETAPVAGSGDSHAPTCPPGFSWSKDKCVRGTAPSTQCRSDNVAPCRDACSRGDRDACETEALAIVGMAERGKVSPELLATAARSLTDNCSAGMAAACNLRGFMLAHGYGGPVDGPGGVEFYQRACTMGSESACNNLGYSYQWARGVPRDVQRALTLYKRACDGGEPLGCSNLGVMYDVNGPLPLNVDLANKFYRRGCVGNNGLACENLGTLLTRQKDFLGAFGFLQRGCALQDDGACGKLGTAYFYGQGVTGDVPKGLAYMQQGCRTDSYACESLGLAYADPKAGVRNDARAIEAYGRACAGTVYPNDVPRLSACVRLGVMARDGIAMAKDPRRALSLFVRACSAATARNTSVGIDRCGLAGQLSETGNGVPRDLKAATDVYRLGCKGNDRFSCERLKKLGAH